MEEVVKFLKACGAYFLATADGDQPRVRPFGTANIFEGKLYIQTGKSKECSKQIQKNGKVEICEPKVHMLENYPELKSMYSPDDDNTETLYFKDATATFYSFGAAPRTVKF